MEKQIMDRKRRLHRVVSSFVICLLPVIGLTQKSENYISDSTLFEIYFADGFDSDTVRFIINDLTISKKMILNSNPYYGQCEARVTGKYYSSDSIRLLVNNGINEEIILLKKRKKYKLKLITIYERKSFVFVQKKGNYLLIYRVPNKKIIFGQRVSRPSFE